MTTLLSPTGERRVRSLQRFAEHDAPLAPAGLRRGLSRQDWLALSSTVRLERLRAAVAEQSGSVGETPSPPGRTPSPSTEPAPVSRRSRVTHPASRYVVPCAGSCGRMLPARGPRPVVRFCSDAPGQSPKRPRRPGPFDWTRDVRESVGTPSRRTRPRAVCSGCTERDATPDGWTTTAD